MIAAALVVAFTMSTSSVFAASLKLPGGSKLGEVSEDSATKEDKDSKAKNKNLQIRVATKSELKQDNANTSKAKHEGKLYFDGKIDEMWTAEIGLNIETKTDNAKRSESEKWKMYGYNTKLIPIFR